MKGLKYLLFTTMKNSIKQLRKNPAKLILIIVFIALLVFTVFASSLDNDIELNSLRSINELYAIIFVLYMFLFIMMSFKGLSSGASFYSMADINILFSTPISSKKILIYGLIKQMGTSLWVGFFLIYQYAWLNNTYNLSFGGLLWILLGYCIVVFCSQLTAMAIYSFSSNNERLKRIIKATMVALNFIIILYVLYNYMSNSQDTLSSAVKSINSIWLNFIPVAGWMKMAVVGTFSVNYHYILGGFGLIIIYIFLIVHTLSKTDSDFYEDVLQATEVSFNAITAKKQGNICETTGKVKLGKIGINRGMGANVFFYKHLLEDRRSGLFILDKTTLLFLGISIFYTIITKDANSILPIFVFTTYMQVFSSATGRWIRELTKPYVYMIPINAFIKLVMISKENILKICVESIILYISIGIILNLSTIEIVACILARIGFGILFMSGNILTERILGSLGSKVVIMFFYIIIMILLALPGAVIGMFVASSIFFLSPIYAGLIITAVWNVLISILIVFLCRDILNCAELNNK